LTAPARLPIEGAFPELGGATAWLNSEPLTPAGLRGRVVVVQFCTFSCINWLRTVPYVKAWAEKYRDDGLVVIGVHSPEFPFEHDHFGEEDYERSERVIQRLLAEAGSDDVDDDLVSVQADGVHLAADWHTLGSPETYVGYARTTGFASPGGLEPDRSRFYVEPSQLALNRWALSGDWTVGEQITTLNEPGGRIVHRFRGRDVNLVLGSWADGAPIRFRVLLDGQPPNRARGLDVDERGNGTVSEERLYQLIRQDGPISARTFEITFIDAGAQAYVFTFG
jgi:thiol-disulfide isomerase/thioredoxin